MKTATAGRRRVNAEMSTGSDWKEVETAVEMEANLRRLEERQKDRRQEGRNA